MATRSRICFSLGIFSLLLFTATDSSACMCGRPNAKTMRDVAAWYSRIAKANTVVFEGAVEKQELIAGPIGAPPEAMSMTVRGAHRAVAIRVLHVYSGQMSQIVTVLTGIGAGDCGFDFQTGKQYLVNADRIDSEHLFTSICTGSELLEHAGAALRLLRGEAPTPDDLLSPQSFYEKFGPKWTGTACGRVIKQDQARWARRRSI